MASISDDDGLKRLQFISPDGRRRSVRLGRVDRRTAEEIRVRVQKLAIAAQLKTAVDDETARWVMRSRQCCTRSSRPPAWSPPAAAGCWARGSTATLPAERT